MRVFDSEIVLSAEVAGAEGVTVKLTALSDVLPENGYIEANAVEDEDQLELMKTAADDILKAENRRVTDLLQQTSPFTMKMEKQFSQMEV